ncbi:unnamed protein product, partial [Pocillopora meandrina]
VNPLHPNISIHILHTVLCTFTNVLTRRICLVIKRFLRFHNVTHVHLAESCLEDWNSGRSFIQEKKQINKKN